jgi:hypothetical protein
MAIHAVWQDYPGVSLLARGDNSPMVTAIHDGGAIVYGSEIDSVYSIIKAMGLKADPEKGWSYRTMDSGCAVLVYDGLPIEWFAFTPYTRTAFNNATEDFYWARYLPSERRNAKPEMVYATDARSDFPHKVKGKMSARNLIKKAAYTRKSQGHEFPTSNGELSIKAVLSEADRIIDVGGMVHAFFGNIEIVLTNGRIVRDVYNHDLPFSMDDRWVRLEKDDADKKDDTDKPMIANDISWDAFSIKKMTKVNNVPDTVPEYKFIKDRDSKKGRTTPIGSPGVKNGSPTIRDIKGRVLLKPEFILDWVNRGDGVVRINEHVISHIHHKGLGFVVDAHCTIHNEKLSQHDQPLNCKNVMLSASYTMSHFRDLSLFWYFENSYPIMTEPPTPKGGSDGYCETKCYFYDKEEIHIYSENSYWKVPVGEECYQCGAYRYIETPSWFGSLNHSERLDIGWIYAY